MRLFHISEEENIEIFHPRLPSRKDLDPSVPLVWAIDQTHLPNFLTPRNCPRVTYHLSPNTTIEDRQRFFASETTEYAVVLEKDWYKAMCNSILYKYEFEIQDFKLQDAVAGYYVATTSQIPIGKERITDLFGALMERNVEIRLTDNLWNIAEAVKRSTLNWSACRMGYAKPPRENK